MTTLTIDDIHAQGAKRHTGDWLAANLAAVQVLQDSPYDPANPTVQKIISLIVLRVLDAVKRENQNTLQLAHEEKKRKRKLARREQAKRHWEKVAAENKTQGEIHHQSSSLLNPGKYEPHHDGEGDGRWFASVIPEYEMGVMDGRSSCVGNHDFPILKILPTRLGWNQRKKLVKQVEEEGD